MQGAMSIVLHGHPVSSATARVRIVLGLKNIEHEFQVLDVFKHEHRGEAYRAVNPLAQVPTLDIDGHRLTQSIAICEYLDETRPEPPLLPRDPLARARCREVVEIVNSGIQPLQNKGVREQLAELVGRELDFEVWPNPPIRKGLSVLENKLRVTAGPYCLGEQVTLADVVLAPQLTASVHQFQLDLTPFPTLTKIHAALGEIPAFAAAR